MRGGSSGSRRQFRRISPLRQTRRARRPEVGACRIRPGQARRPPHGRIARTSLAGEGASMTLFVIMLLAADPTGRFDKEGRRLEDVPAAANATPEEASYRTIAEWEKVATAARSKTRRAEGARAVLRVCVHNHKTPLTEEERTAAEGVAIKLLAAQEAEVRRDAASVLGTLRVASAAEALR